MPCPNVTEHNAPGRSGADGASLHPFGLVLERGDREAGVLRPGNLTGGSIERGERHGGEVARDPWARKISVGEFADRVVEEPAASIGVKRLVPHRAGKAKIATGASHDELLGLERSQK